MDYSLAIASLVTLFIVSLILERSLALIFQWRWWKKYLDGIGLKTVLAFAVALAICKGYNFDAFAMMFGKESQIGGILVTALFVSGGSKLILSIISQIKAFQNQDGKDVNGK